MGNYTEDDLKPVMYKGHKIEFTKRKYDRSFNERRKWTPVLFSIDGVEYDSFIQGNKKDALEEAKKYINS